MMTGSETIELLPGSTTLSDLRRVFREVQTITLSPSAKQGVEESACVIGEIIEGGKVVYGVNTGFGKFSQVRISPAQLETLQRNLVLSHSTGVGPLLPDETVRLMMVLKVLALARGLSGIRYLIIDALLRMINAGVYPCIPAKGSVGASGDLAPLAHLASAMIGVGSVRVDGRIVAAKEGLARAGLEPLRLGPKEGVGLVNGTQTSTALALNALFAAEDVLAAAIVAGAMSVEAAAGLHDPYDPRIHSARGQAGQIAVAQLIRRFVEHSEIRKAHANSGKVQDPYSLRCQAQVMGACLDSLSYAARVLKIESNGVSDSPLIFTKTGDVLSGGNFHAEPVAMVSDILALAFAVLASISERRIAMLMDTNFSGLPPFLVCDGGLNSGFMNAQVTAAALASENKSLAHPACVDSIPTSANQEDHVSMATFAAYRLLGMAQNTSTIVGIELLAAAQGIELRRPLRSSDTIERVVDLVRSVSRHYGEDRFFAPDIAHMAKLVSGSAFYRYAAEVLPTGREEAATDNLDT